MEMLSGDKFLVTFIESLYLFIFVASPKSKGKVIS